METVIRVIYKSALGLWLFISGSALLYSIIMSVMYNGIGNIFKYIPVDHYSYTLENDTTAKRNRIVLKYQYSFDNHTYNDEHPFLAEDMIVNVDSAVVYCNSVIPSFSMMEGVPNSSYKQKLYLVQICVSFFFFLFAFLIWRFADHDKWIGVYARGEYKTKKQREQDRKNTSI
ncbi:hypothetical protein [Bacteroides sp. UBA939]|uniref:hypothetical protein n=1 Tax=Bacteroides sp. UBA939 TaxID=1946092 RepID=UPI0025BF6652|nr:hypothetical protein [Bacteroides sp. UBA939]